MIRERWLLAIAVSMSLSGCTCIENAAFGPPERLESPSEPLPKLFAPLRWDTSEAQLPQLFRGFRVVARRLHAVAFASAPHPGR